MEKDNKKIMILSLLLAIAIVLSICGVKDNLVNKIKIEKIENIPEGTWQAEISFPDWKGFVDDSLAMNSMYSFDSYENQGKIYLNVNEDVEEYDLFVNNVKINTDDIKKGIYEIDISKITKNGINTLQISNIEPNKMKEAIKVYIPYPVVISGDLEDVGLSEESFDLIDDIITSDINHGFSSASLAVIKDGKLVYQNSWGYVNTYNPDGSKIEDGIKVTNDTLYDLASNTKMFATAYAVQYLVDQGKLSLDDKIVDIIGTKFVDKTIEIKFESFGDDYPGLDKIKEWKSKLTVKDIMMHRAGFPDSGHYNNEYFDIVKQELSNDVKNVLYIENANKEKTLSAICKTPLIYKPNTKTLYSDIDYMLLGLIVEKVTNQDLNDFLADIYWKPMNLKNITYNPLLNGFKQENIAATELTGNTRDGLVSYPGIRKDTIQGQVHDEAAYYLMEGVSGHAGLFASATDLAKLGFVMLSGGYDNNKFFTKNTRDYFISPQYLSNVQYGIGWWREADDKRVWYFGTQSPESTVGHQGWTGTLTMIDFENNMIVVFLTNSVNTPLADNSSLETANSFNGRYYTTSTLGFVPQIIYMGLDNNDIKDNLDSLIKNMAMEKKKLIEEQESENGKKFDSEHAIIKAKEALDEVVIKRMKG